MRTLASSSQVTTDCSKSFRWFFCPARDNIPPLAVDISSGGFASNCVSFVSLFSSLETSRYCLSTVFLLIAMKSFVWSRMNPCSLYPSLDLKQVSQTLHQNPLTGSCWADLESFIWYIVWSSQNKRPHFLQFTLPFTGPNLFPHAGSVHRSLYPALCQCVLVTTSSGSGRAGSGVDIRFPGITFGIGECEVAGTSFDSNTSNPLSF